MTTISIDNNGNVTAISKVSALPIEITPDCPFYFDWNLAQFYKYVNGTWVEIPQTQFTIEAVNYDWVQQKAIITLTNGEVLEFACSESWTEADCIAAIQSVPKYANANPI